MSGSWKIARVAGIPIYVHWTFLILLIWIVFGHWTKTHDVTATLLGVGFVLALFGCVVLHELGHALAALRFGVPTADITLLPIGGVARLQRIPEHPGQELVVALAGPAVNVLIAGILWLLGVRPEVVLDDTNDLVAGGFLPRLLEVNLFLVAFNLLPAFPMDGGRVLRALLAMVMDYGRATALAARIGQVMAMLFAFVGLTGNPILLLIALFVWIGAEAEAAQVGERLALKGLSVRAAMLTEYHTLRPDHTLGDVADLLLAGTQQDFPVAEDGRLAGILTRADLLAGLSRSGRSAPVSAFLRRELGAVEADAPLVPAIARLREGEGPCLQVTEAGRPVGLLTLENVGEFLMIKTALEGLSTPGERRQQARAYRAGVGES